MNMKKKNKQKSLTALPMFKCQEAPHEAPHISLQIFIFSNLQPFQQNLYINMIYKNNN